MPIPVAYSITTGDWSWCLYLIVYLQVVKLFSSTIGMHRYFAHRAFKTGPIRHKILAYLTVLIASRSPIVFAMNHRHHHRYSDLTNDTHSPQNSFWKTLTGVWEFNNYEWFKDRGMGNINVKDLVRDPTLVFIERNYYKIWAWLILITLLINWKIALFILLPAAGYFHLMAGLINTAGHWNFPGSYRNFNTTDKSQNNWIWGVFTVGEGYQNNHHHDMNNTNFGKRWFEIDIGYIFTRLLFDINDPLIKFKRS